jgi:hypothetical protein
MAALAPIPPSEAATPLPSTEHSARQTSTLLINGINKVAFDGKGNFTQVDAVATNVKLDAPDRRPGTGTYSVNPDCTGTQTIVVQGLPDLH